MFVDRSYREPLAPAPQMQNDPVKGLHGTHSIPREFTVRIDRVWRQRRHASPLGRVDHPHTGIDGQSIVVRSGDHLHRGQFCPAPAFGGRWAPFGVVSVVPKEPRRKVLVLLALTNESGA